MSIALYRKRWIDVCRAWGIECPGAAEPGYGEALAAMADWLDSGDPRRAVRATQVLLADPDTSEAAKLPSVEAVWRVIDDWDVRHATTAGPALRVLQALLLAVWHDQPRASAVAALLDLAWSARHGPERQQALLELWRDEFSRVAFAPDLHGGDADQGMTKLHTDSTGVRDALVELTRRRRHSVGLNVYGPPLVAVLHAMYLDVTKLLSPSERRFLHGKHAGLQDVIEQSNDWTYGPVPDFRQVLNEFLHVFRDVAVPMGILRSLDSLDWLESQHDSVFYQYQQVSPYLLSVLGDLFAAIRQRSHQEQVEQLGTLLPLSQKEVANEHGLNIDLVWWGQARYSHFLGVPFRKLAGQPSRVLFFACVEAADRTSNQLLNPACSFLVEVLSALGQEPSQLRPLHSWMAELHTLLSGLDDGEALPMVGALAELVDEDPLGLPVSHVRRLAERHLPFARDSIRHAVGLDLDTLVDCGDWASWIFRERLLERRVCAARA